MPAAFLELGIVANASKGGRVLCPSRVHFAAQNSPFCATESCKLLPTIDVLNTEFCTCTNDAGFGVDRMEKLEYRKTTHSIELTERFIAHDPGKLTDVADTLRDALRGSKPLPDPAGPGESELGRGISRYGQPDRTQNFRTMGQVRLHGGNSNMANYLDVEIIGN